jgi:hypothetical protein
MEECMAINVDVGVDDEGFTDLWRCHNKKCYKDGLVTEKQYKEVEVVLDEWERQKTLDKDM